MLTLQALPAKHKGMSSPYVNTKSPYVRLTWRNEDGRKRTVWAKQLSEMRFMACSKDGEVWKGVNATTERAELIILDPANGRARIQPAGMSKTYGTLEVVKNA